MTITRTSHSIEVWGTVLVIDAASTSVTKPVIDEAMNDVREFVFGVDRDFSTYKNDSYISRLRRQEIQIGECPQQVQDVWDACQNAKYLSDGAFDPWAVDGGFDPSGYVKGWAAGVVADVLVAAGCQHVQVDAAGDLALRGGNLLPNGIVEPWRIGVINPDNRNEVVRVFEIFDGAIATSGTYERGAHITDPYTGTIAIGAQSATVIGTDGGLTDALATALMVTGDDGAKLFGQPELAGYNAWCIDRHEGTAWGVGPIFAEEIAAQAS
jgi:thiamine biosynthesis lipoprotein